MVIYIKHYSYQVVVQVYLWIIQLLRHSCRFVTSASECLRTSRLPIARSINAFPCSQILSKECQLKNMHLISKQLAYETFLISWKKPKKANIIFRTTQWNETWYTLPTHARSWQSWQNMDYLTKILIGQKFLVHLGKILPWSYQAVSRKFLD